jgi:D-methionine transport system substrate-binding protein
VNVVCVDEKNKDTDLAKALAAAALSQDVVDYFAGYDGTAISVVENPTDGYDATVDYSALAGQKVKVVCTLDPHSFVLEKVKAILAAKDIDLEIITVDDYVTPNTMVDSGDVFANFFAHLPYQDDFNANNNTHLVSIAGVHVEPMGLYAGKQADLAKLGK